MRTVAATALVLLVATSCASRDETTGGTSTTSRGTVAVTGKVVSAPSCPVMQDASPCPPRPAPGAAVTAFAGATMVGTTSADRSGHFVLRLAPGTYRIQARMPAGLRSTASVHVTVAGAPVSVTISLDSGIR